VFYKFHALLNVRFILVALYGFLFLSGIFHFLPQSHSPAMFLQKASEICSAKNQKSIKGNL